MYLLHAEKTLAVRRRKFPLGNFDRRNHSQKNFCSCSPLDPKPKFFTNQYHKSQLSVSLKMKHDATCQSGALFFTQSSGVNSIPLNRYPIHQIGISESALRVSPNWLWLYGRLQRLVLPRQVCWVCLPHCYWSEPSQTKLSVDTPFRGRWRFSLTKRHFR